MVQFHICIFLIYIDMFYRVFIYVRHTHFSWDRYHLYPKWLDPKPHLELPTTAKGLLQIQEPVRAGVDSGAGVGEPLIWRGTTWGWLTMG